MHKRFTCHHLCCFLAHQLQKYVLYTMAVDKQSKCIRALLSYSCQRHANGKRPVLLVLQTSDKLHVAAAAGKQQAEP